MSDLWRAFVASSTDGQIRYCHTFYCPTLEDAHRIAAQNGWELDGEVTEELDELDEEVAMLEKALSGGELH